MSEESKDPTESAVTVGELVDRLAELEVKRSKAERAYLNASPGEREAHVQTLRALARSSHAVQTHLAFLWSSLVG